MQGKGIIWQAPVIILAAVLLLMGVQVSPAHARFNDTETGAMAVAAARIPAPAANTVTVTKSCDSFLWFGQAKISVGAFTAVPYANYHELKIIDPDGVVQFTGDMSKASGKSYSSGVQSVSSLSGTWTYQIRGYYKVPNSINAWTGQALTGTLSCP
ncbi:hypothetical protein SAMN04487917_11538 [Arthrobacter sp. yr096]|uniref:hypothetical protein n=1 Tax=unclassified Arthrobacter TaxID=235627 RepID=UPI00089D5748|nr:MULTISPECIES: hypothetical protein [unclassified Arthrobacter]SDX54759.1 hypothetical protein SAMN04487912_1163 [Arthrobacter sp. cf158]SEJ81778.1 hypothetical protein SAMN04487917_11538 [Arthrobacter sp. yr096]